MSLEERWNAKLKAALSKSVAAARKIPAMPERIASKSRIRATADRAAFAPWLSNLTPAAGLQNDFRTMLFRNEMRALENRRAVNSGESRLVRMRAPIETLKPTAPRNSGIQLFFQNSIDHSPLPGLTMSGGALTQLGRTRRDYRDAEDRLIQMAKEQARQKTATRSDMPVTQTMPVPVTALDEAKLLIASELETIGQQLFRGLYSPEVLRDIGRLLPTIARNAPLLSGYALRELIKYVSDLARVTLANSKNIGKEIAEDALEAADDVPGAEEEEEGAPPSIETITIGDIPPYVEDKRTAAEAIYARLEAIVEFLTNQAAVADRDPRTRIAMAQSNLSLLGLSGDRKRYPTAARELIERNEREEAAKRAAEAEAAELPPAGAEVYDQALPEEAGMMPVDIADIPAADVLPEEAVPDGAAVADKPMSAAIIDVLLDVLMEGKDTFARDGELFALLGQVAGKPIITNAAAEQQKLSAIRRRARQNRIYLTQPGGTVVSFDTVAMNGIPILQSVRQRYGAADLMAQID